jgi:uncharacterized protein YndB with AHSA1/START domain
MGTSGTTRNPVTRQLDADPDRVFAVLSDGWLYPAWVVGAVRMRDVDPEWPSVGSRLHHSVGAWPLTLDDETEVLHCTPGSRLVLQARGWPVGEATVDVRIEPLPPGRSLVTIFEDASKGPGRYVPAPLRAVAVRLRNREALRRLAFVAEGRQAPGDPWRPTGPGRPSGLNRP